MAAVLCPHCNEERSEVSRSIKECAGCGKTFPECPTCGSGETDFCDIDQFGCYQCGAEFSPPESLRNKGRRYVTGQGELTDRDKWNLYWDQQKDNEYLKTITKEELVFLIYVVEQMSSELGKDLPEHLRRSTSPTLSDQEYLQGVFLACVRIAPLLELRKNSIENPSEKLRSASWFSHNIVAKNSVMFYPERDVRLEYGQTIREAVDGLLADAAKEQPLK